MIQEVWQIGGGEIRFDDDCADEVVVRCVGREADTTEANRRVEPIPFENRIQQPGRIFGREMLVTVDSQGGGLEDKAEAATEAARRFDQQHLLAQRQITLRQKVAEIGGRFHPPWQASETGDRLTHQNV